MLNGHPISAKLPEDLGFGERFWYWRGTSGQSYIHSIYSRETCPPLPGAVFVVVRNSSGIRRPVAVGRFPAMIEGARMDFTAVMRDITSGDEIHVHLLARDMEAAERVRRDLFDALQQSSGAVAEESQADLVDA